MKTPKKKDFDLPYLKGKIQDTQRDEICILSGGFANYYTLPDDIAEWLSDQLGQYVYINQYQDLCCDPYGLNDGNTPGRITITERAVSEVVYDGTIQVDGIEYPFYTRIIRDDYNGDTLGEVFFPDEEVGAPDEFDRDELFETLVENLYSSDYISVK